ncbi:solute carrier family 23 member 3 [Discoglossus pictus]
MSMICCGTAASRLPSYKLHHTPPWLLSFFFALQHLLVQASLLCTCHYLLLQSRPLGLQDQSRLLASSLFACGIATALQTSLGTRLPLAQAPTFELLIPALILSKHSISNGSATNNTEELQCTSQECEPSQNGLQPISEVSGALLVSGGLQVLFGVTGLWGWIIQHSGPMVIAPTLSIIGFSCYKQAALCCSSSWGIALLLICATGLLSQNFRSCHLPVYTWKPKEGTEKKYVPAFRMFSMLIPISCIWIVCIILRIIEEHPELQSTRLAQNGSIINATNPRRVFIGLRDDSDQIPWFQIPSLGGWGWPQLSLRTLSVGVAMAVISSLSSLGCYVVCSRMLSCPPVPSHACNRGICMEGIGNILSAFLGSICGTGSSIPNAGMAGLTQVGSRNPVHISALLFIILGSSPKLSEILMSIPLAVHGAVLCLTFSMAVGAGVSYFQYADIDSGRNIFIVGFAMFMALLVPRWLEAVPGQLVTGWQSLDLLLLSLLTVPVFLVGICSFILDNTVTGTLRERGLDCNHTLSLPVSGQDISRTRQDELAQAYGLPCALTRFFPAVYPFKVLCPPQPHKVTVEGEEDKLLTKPPGTDPEQR